MATKAICMVKVIKLQNPLPKATLTATGEAPLISAASATTTTEILPRFQTRVDDRDMGLP
jgi:hypothetical protein